MTPSATQVSTTSSAQPAVADYLLNLQRTAGNAAVNQILQRWQDDAATNRKGQVGTDAAAPFLDKAGNLSLNASAASGNVQRPHKTANLAKPFVQRHAEGTELPSKGESAGEVGKKLSPPSATRTKKQETQDQSAANISGSMFRLRQILSPRAMSLAGAQTILTGAYGGMKKIVPGTIVVLADQPACAAKYDEVCIAAGLTREDGVTPWAPGDCAKDDATAGTQTEGFAWNGVVYVNGATTLVTATAHEMLHNNTSSNFRKKMGETFNEGVTEYLARKALVAAGIPVPGVTAYPEQVAIVQDLIALVGEDAVMKAYFSGADSLIRAIGSKANGKWKAIRVAAEGLQADTIKLLLAPKVKKSFSQKLGEALTIF